MADTVTANYNLTKPEDGASNNTWGAKLNANLDTIDGLIKTNATAIAAKFPSAGGPITGNVTITGTFGVTGAATLSGGAAITGNVSVTGVVSLTVNNQSLSFKDVNGGTPLFICQADNNFVFYGTDAAGGQRGIWGIVQHSDTSGFVLAVPTFAPTPPNADNTTRVATTAFVQSALATYAQTGALSAYIQKVGDTINGNLVRASAGPHLYHVNPAFESGRVFVTAAGAADPTSQPGDIWIELA